MATTDSFHAASSALTLFNCSTVTRQHPNKMNEIENEGKLEPLAATMVRLAGPDAPSCAQQFELLALISLAKHAEWRWKSFMLQSKKWAGISGKEYSFDF